MVRREFYIFSVLAAACILCFGTSGYARDDIEIVDVAWTSAVIDREPVDRIATTSVAPPVIFWTRAKGTARTLESLRARGKLPLHHRWIRYLGAQAEISRSVITDDIVAAIGNERQFDALQVELDQRGYFDWRLWSEKRNLPPGSWAVRILYADGEPVICRQSSSALAACEFRFLVSRGAGR